MWVWLSLPLLRRWTHCLYPLRVLGRAFQTRVPSPTSTLGALIGHPSSAPWGPWADAEASAARPSGELAPLGLLWDLLHACPRPGTARDTEACFAVHPLQSPEVTQARTRDPHGSRPGTLPPGSAIHRTQIPGTAATQPGVGSQEPCCTQGPRPVGQLPSPAQQPPPHDFIRDLSPRAVGPWRPPLAGLGQADHRRPACRTPTPASSAQTPQVSLLPVARPGRRGRHHRALEATRGKDLGRMLLSRKPP